MVSSFVGTSALTPAGDPAAPGAVETGSVMRDLPLERGGGSLLIWVSSAFAAGSHIAASGLDFRADREVALMLVDHTGRGSVHTGGTVAVTRVTDQVQMTMAVEMSDGITLTGQLSILLPD